MQAATNIIDFDTDDHATDTASPPLVVMLTSGPDDSGKRATLAYATALTAIGMDTPTIVFLAGDGAFWGYEGHADDYRMNGFPPLRELVEAFEELGGETCICSTCDRFCGLSGNEANPGHVRRDSVKPRGLAAILPQALGDCY